MKTVYYMILKREGREKTMKTSEKNYCPSVEYIKNGEKLFRSMTDNHCGFKSNNEEPLKNPNSFRMTCENKCGECCVKSHCGSWLPCEFIDFNNQRRDLILEDESVGYSIHWKKIIAYVSKKYATVRKFNKIKTEHFFLDIPKTERGCCALLTQSGCKLDFYHRPIKGALYTCNKNSEMNNAYWGPCWLNDSYLQGGLSIIYEMEQTDEFRDINEDDITRKLQLLRKQ